MYVLWRCDIVFILWEAFCGYCEWESNLNMDFNVELCLSQCVLAI